MLHAQGAKEIMIQYKRVSCRGIQKAESEVGSSDSEASESASDSEQNDPPSSLASDAEQYELMQASWQWARTFMIKKISLGRSTPNCRDWNWFLRNGPWRGYPSLYKNVWTILTEYWPGVAGKFMLRE